MASKPGSSRATLHYQAENVASAVVQQVIRYPEGCQFQSCPVPVIVVVNAHCSRSKPHHIHHGRESTAETSPRGASTLWGLWTEGEPGPGPVYPGLVSGNGWVCINWMCRCLYFNICSQIRPVLSSAGGRRWCMIYVVMFCPQSFVSLQNRLCFYQMNDTANM